MYLSEIRTITFPKKSLMFFLEMPLLPPRAGIIATALAI